ncbi:MAG TPA: hypothetical protein VEC16_00885 [Alphaproteobacteria bacterium]|nr:hypothetical protein [Alphaproteobacteria bacterium]
MNYIRNTIIVASIAIGSSTYAQEHKARFNPPKDNSLEILSRAKTIDSLMNAESPPIKDDFNRDGLLDSAVFKNNQADSRIYLQQKDGSYIAYPLNAKEVALPKDDPERHEFYRKPKKN